MGRYDSYAKDVLRAAFEDRWNPEGDVVFSFGEGAGTGQVDGTIDGEVAVEIGAGSPKQVRASVLDLVFHPYRCKLLLLVDTPGHPTERSVVQAATIMSRMNTSGIVYRIANNDNRPLAKMELTELVDRYLRETEQDLDRVFAVSEPGQQILTFESSEGLFAGRKLEDCIVRNDKSDGIDIPSLAECLTSRRGPLPSEIRTAERGVYALWLTTKAFDILGVNPGRGGVAYAGAATGPSGLAARFREEWRPDHSGRSSPRRTLGVLLLEVLSLTSRPRPGSGHPRDAEYFTFGVEGERDLGDWIDTHRSFAYVEVRIDDLPSGVTVASLETDLIAYLQPPLNINKWENPIRRTLIGLRADAKTAARDWRP